MDLASLVYFHTDHFEPWRSVRGAPAVGQETVDAIGEFCRVSERIVRSQRPGGCAIVTTHHELRLNVQATVYPEVVSMYSNGQLIDHLGRSARG